MTQSFGYSSAPSSWDSFNHYIALDNDYPSSHTVLGRSRPCSSSSSSSHLLASDKQPRFEAASWHSNGLYPFDLQHSVDSPLTSPEPESEPLSPPPNVKQEDTQDDFVFELPAANNPEAVAFPAFSSMTEVPLRATQASKEMRRMMGVFRLDPFTMHNAVRDPSANITWNGEQIGPLKEEPTLHEFQLETYDRVKSEPPPALHHVPVGDPDRDVRRRRASPHLELASPTPSMYGSLDPPSPLDSQSHGWSGSSSDSLVYSPDLVRHNHQPFDTVLTPAQVMDASMNMDFHSRYSSSSSLRMPSHTQSTTSSLSAITRQRSPLSHSLSYAPSSSPGMNYSDVSPASSSPSSSFMHPTSTMSSSPQYSHSSLSSSYPSYISAHPARQSLAYTTTSPVRLPPPAPSRYPVQELGLLGGGTNGGNGSGHADEGTDGMWLRKTTISLAMFYNSSTGKDSAGSSTPSGGGGGMHLTQPHMASTIAARRMASSTSSSSSTLGGVGGGAHHGVARSGRAAWLE